MIDDVCDFCQGVGKSSSNVCVYCNGTGEWNQAAQAYVKNHICQCIVLDRKFCPICNKSCHHGTSLNPKQNRRGLLPGYQETSSCRERQAGTADRDQGITELVSAR